MRAASASHGASTERSPDAATLGGTPPRTGTGTGTGTDSEQSFKDGPQQIEQRRGGSAEGRKPVDGKRLFQQVQGGNVNLLFARPSARPSASQSVSYMRLV